MGQGGGQGLLLCAWFSLSEVLFFVTHALFHTIIYTLQPAPQVFSGPQAGWQESEVTCYFFFQVCFPASQPSC